MLRFLRQEGTLPGAECEMSSAPEVLNLQMHLAADRNDELFSRLC